MRKRIQTAELPFHTQQMTAANWQEEGFSSLAEAESWSGRGCGIASLRMVLEGLGCACGRQGEMISKGLAAGAYQEGVGWMHGKLAEMAGDYGVFGEAKRGKTLADLQKDLENGFVCMASVTPYFRFGQQKPDGSLYGTGGHLVPVYGCETEGGKAVAFLLHHPSMYAACNVPHWAVTAEAFESSFSGNYIRFRKAGTLRQAAAADALVMSRIYAASWKAAFRGNVPDEYLDGLAEDHWVTFFEKALTEGSLSAKLIFDKERAVGAVAYGAAQTTLPVGGTLVGSGGDYSAFGEVASLYLLPEYYDKGYGRELLEKVRGELLEDHEGVYLWVLRENERARAFYEKLGFVPTEDACLCEIEGKTLTDIRYVYHKYQ